jgi:hypothetical protein
LKYVPHGLLPCLCDSSTEELIPSNLCLCSKCTSEVSLDQFIRTIPYWWEEALVGL